MTGDSSMYSPPRSILRRSRTDDSMMTGMTGMTDTDFSYGQVGSSDMGTAAAKASILLPLPMTMDAGRAPMSVTSEEGVEVMHNDLGDSGNLLVGGDETESDVDDGISDGSSSGVGEAESALGSEFMTDTRIHHRALMDDDDDDDSTSAFMGFNTPNSIATTGLHGEDLEPGIFPPEPRVVSPDQRLSSHNNLATAVGAAAFRSDGGNPVAPSPPSSSPKKSFFRLPSRSRSTKSEVPFDEVDMPFDEGLPPPPPPPPPPGPPPRRQKQQQQQQQQRIPNMMDDAASETSADSDTVLEDLNNLSKFMMERRSKAANGSSNDGSSPSTRGSPDIIGGGGRASSNKVVSPNGPGAPYGRKSSAESRYSNYSSGRNDRW